MTTVPRKLYKWFDRLDLTYSIRNLRMDLANGFVVAEILSRYLPEIKMYQFYNDLSMSKRRDNWERIVKILRTHGKSFTPYDYEPVMFLANGAAYEFIKELYAFLEKDEIIETKKHEKKKTPYYLKPTATLLMKDTELNRIIDNKERFNEKVNVLRYHYAKSRAEKQDLNLEEFINKQKQEMLKRNAKKLFNNKNKKSKTIEPQQNQPKEIVLKNLEGNKKKSKENQETHDSDAITEALDSILTSLFDREDNRKYINQMPSNLAEGKPEKEIGIVHLVKTTYEYPPELVQKLLEALNKSSSDIKDALSNSYKDFRSFIIYILQFLENLEANTILYELLKSFISKVGKELLEDESQADVTSLFMESEGLKQITEMAQNVSNKRDMLAHIIMSFTPKNPDSHYRILEKLAGCFKSDLRNLSSILAHVSCYCDDEIDSRIFYFYFYKSINIIHFSYPTMKANGLKILNEISKFHKTNFYSVSENLERLAGESWWEIKAQILIICANQLEYIENHENGSQVQKTEHHDEIGEEEMSVPEAKARLETEEVDGFTASEVRKSRSGMSNMMINSSLERTAFGKTEMEEALIPADEYIQKLIEIINKIFHIHQNINVQKVGLIYLAKILNYYPELCERYLAVLLTINDEVKSTILNNDEAYNIESHIVLTSNSFKYYQTGASLIWNSPGLASALNEFVKNENLDAFEFKHIEILAGCFVREIYSEDKEKWLEIYSDLQKYIFISLTAPDQCKISSHIIKKVFLNQDLCETVMETSKDLFLRIMELIYQPDIEEECKENILELFNFLVSESELYKEYVYQIIKRFSEKSHSRFLRTNIIQFMNELARERRAKMFGDNTFETLSF